jgi:hypothetical protein
VGRTSSSRESAIGLSTSANRRDDLCVVHHAGPQFGTQELTNEPQFKLDDTEVVPPVEIPIHGRVGQARWKTSRIDCETGL